MDDLAGEAERPMMLTGKEVRQVWRHRAGEVGIECIVGKRLFVDQNEERLRLSITGGKPDDGKAL